MNDLAIYSRAKQAIAEYKTVDEVKDFRDKALAVEAYAKQANDMELEWDAARARVRAERKCGELLREMEKAKGNQNTGEFGGRNERPPKETKTLAEMGITKDQSSKFQKLAAVPEEEFEKAVELSGTKPSTNHILKAKEAPPARMDSDALYLWGALREMRTKGVFDAPLADYVGEWTDAMRADAVSIIPLLKKWVNDYES